MRERIEKLGTWWIVQVRVGTDWRHVSRVLECRNRRSAGARGSKRKIERKYPRGGWGAKDELKFVTRQWALRAPYSSRLFSRAYKFDDLKDAQGVLNCGVIQRFREGDRQRGKRIKKEKRKAVHLLIVEIVEIQGCLNTGTCVSKRVIERHFDEGLNEMEQLAIEFALGEQIYEHPRKDKLLGVSGTQA